MPWADGFNPVGVVWFFGLLFAVAAAGEDAAPEARVTERQLGGARLVEATLPGHALDVAVLPGGVAVLVVPGDDADAPRSLFRFDPSGGGELRELARDLPPAVDAVASFDVDGDGSPELIVGEPGRVHRLAAGRGSSLLLEAPEIDLARTKRLGLLRPAQTLLLHPEVGRLAIYRAGADGSLALADEVPLPVRARRRPTGLELTTPRTHLLERPGAPPWLAAGPERQGPRRLLTTLIDPAAGDPAARTAEAWCQLPADERVAESWYLTVDGVPVLAAAALRADKMGIFEKQKLRLFPLRADRTRAGTRPALEIQTVTRNWYSLGVRVTDFDRDGRDDLVVLQPDGLGAKKLAVEVYRGKGGGGFFLTPRRSVVVAPDADWEWGDVDGDGVGDLVVAGGDRRLEVYRGLGASRGKQVLEKTPKWSFEALPAAEAAGGIVVTAGDDGDGDDDSDSDHGGGPGVGALQIVDLDGDGRGEILLRLGVEGRTILRLFQLR